MRRGRTDDQSDSGGGPSRGEIEFPRDLSPLPPTARFLELAQGYGIEFEPHDIERLGHYLALLLAGNSVTNLTGVRDPEVAWETLIFDALTLLPLLADLPEGGRCIDVGTGGGLPGLPLAIVSPQLRFTLLDATGKKIAFVRHAIEQLSLNNAEALQGRAEVLAANANTEHRAAYDVVVSRAVGRVAMLAELTTPLAKVGGTVLLVKGQRADEELAEAKQVLHALHVAHAGTVDTPTGRIVVLDKSRATPAKYPRIADVGRAKGPKR